MIGKPGGDCAHQGPLSAVALAAAAEYADQARAAGRAARRAGPGFCMPHGLAQRAQHLFECVGRVRVIDDHSRARPAAIAFSAPGNCFHLPQCIDRCIETGAACQQRSQ